MGQNWQGQRLWLLQRGERKGREQMFPDLRHGVRVIVRDRDFWKGADLSGALSKVIQDCQSYWGSNSVKSQNLCFIVSETPVYLHPFLAPSSESYIPGPPPASLSFPLVAAPLAALELLLHLHPSCFGRYSQAHASGQSC